MSQQLKYHKISTKYAEVMEECKVIRNGKKVNIQDLCERVTETFEVSFVQLTENNLKLRVVDEQ